MFRDNLPAPKYFTTSDVIFKGPKSVQKWMNTMTSSSFYETVSLFFSSKFQILFLRVPILTERIAIQVKNCAIWNSLHCAYGFEITFNFG